MSTKTEALVSAAMSTLNHLGRMVGNSEHENSRIRAALTAAFSKCALLTAPAEPAPILANARSLMSEKPTRHLSADDLGLSTPTAQGTAADALLDSLTDYLRREMPAGTVICRPDWWAVKIARAIAGQSPAQATGEPASIDTQEFRELMCHLGYWVDEDDAWNDECGAALVEFINRHIAAQAPAGRDAQLVNQVHYWMDRGDRAIKAAEIAELELQQLRPDADRLRWLIEDHDDAEVREKARELAARLGTSSYFAITRDIDAAMCAASHAAEQASGGAHA